MDDIKLFNKPTKLLYLKSFNNAKTVEVYTRVFRKSFVMEENLQKDLFDFNTDEFEQLLKEINPSTKEIARTYGTIINSYVQWGIINRYSIHTINPISRSQQYFSNFANREKKLYLAKEDLDAMMHILVNDQDKFLLMAVFEGVAGKQMCELLELKNDDLIVKRTENNEVKYFFNLTGEVPEGRLIEVSRKTFELAKSASAEKDYYKKNGEMNDSNIKSAFELFESNYVVKKIKNNFNADAKPTHYIFYNRLAMMQNLPEFEDISTALTTKNLMRSGMIYYAKECLERDGELNRHAISEICKRYNVRYKVNFKDFLNEEMIESLYPRYMKLVD